MKRFFPLLLASLFVIISCSSVKTDKEETLEADASLVKKGMKNVLINGQVTSTFAANLTAKFNMKMAFLDSVSLSITLPMGGVILGKLYCTPDYFQFYNTIENSVYEGSPQAENLQSVIMMPLSYNDFIHFLRSESPSPENLFKKQEKDLKEGGMLFKNSSNKDFVEFVVLNDNDKTIKQYQRKTPDGRTILNIFYSDYEEFSGYKLATRIEFSFPELDGRLVMDIKDYEINGNFSAPFSFTLPDGIKRYKL